MRNWPLPFLLLGAGTALAFWAPNHQGMNLQVVREGTPWGGGFVRSQAPVTHFNDYLSHVLYVNEPELPPEFVVEPDACLARRAAGNSAIVGVAFQQSFPTGEDKPTDAPLLGMTPWCWVVKGGLWEDGFNGLAEGTIWGGRRAVNHFHDPLAQGGGGYTGLLNENANEELPYLNLARRGISVTEWVMNGHSGGAFGFNLWGYPTIGEGFHRAFTESSLQRRESGLASALRAMGQMMHLLEDNTVPDHARDLAHPGDGFEEYLRDDPVGKELFGHSDVSTWVPFPVKVIAQTGIRGFWDRDVYSTNPASTVAGFTPGLDEFTNANFLAWNHLRRGGLDIDFSTVPRDVRTGFSRTPRLGSNTPGSSFLYVRFDNLVEYPWPQLDDRQGNLYPPVQGSLPMSSVAQYDPAWTDSVSGPNIIGVETWAQYRVPLMGRAHGYAQSVMSLALQPARAEVVPVATMSGLRLELRVWNLWDAASPHAITWTVDSVKLVAVRPEAVTVPFGEKVSLEVANLNRDVAPGGVLQTTVPITVGQYGTLAWSSYAAILVTAHLANSERTPLKFTVPIPNGFPLVRQTGAVDQTSLYQAPPEDCCTTCTRCGANQAFRNPLTQQATGTIEVFPVKKDIFMKPATPEVEAAAKRDARVSAVALLAFPEPNATFANPTRPANGSGTSLAISGSNLQRIDDGLWMRPVDAPDVPDTAPLGFTVTLNPRTFFFSTGMAEDDGARATGTVYLAVWMSSGALTLQRLVFWPLGPPNTPLTVLGTQMNCQLQSAPRFALPEGRTTVCRSMEMMTGCMVGEEQIQRNSMSVADNGVSRVQWAASEVQVTLTLELMGALHATKFGELALPVGADGKNLPCDFRALGMVYPGGTGRMVCNGFGPGMGYFASENVTRSGFCQQIPPPLEVPRTAEYVRDFVFEDDALRSVFGHTAIPAAPTFTITSQ